MHPNACVYVHKNIIISYNNIFFIKKDIIIHNYLLNDEYFHNNENIVPHM